MGDPRGRTILVTRAAGDAEAWAATLSARGAEAVVFPCIAREPVSDPDTVRELRDALDNADWLALTSVPSVYCVADLVGAHCAAAINVAVVGRATEAAARKVLGRVDLVSGDGTSRSLGVDLARRIREDVRAGEARVVAAGAESPRRDLDEELGSIGVQVRRFVVYRTVPAPVQEPREELAARGVDTIFLASPSAVTGLLARAIVPADARIVTIGPSTSAAARDAGLPVHGEAAGRGLEGMIEAMP